MTVPGRSVLCSRTTGVGRRRPVYSGYHTPTTNDEPEMDGLTQVLSAIERGDPHAAEQLLPLVHLLSKVLKSRPPGHPRQKVRSAAEQRTFFHRIVAPSLTCFVPVK